MLKDKSESVKVVMRCRPLTPKEMEEQRECIVNVDMDVGSIQVYNPQNIKELKSFTFDHSYDWRATQQLIFEQTALLWKDTTVQFLHMGRQEQVRHILWRGMTTKQIRELSPVQ